MLPNYDKDYVQWHPSKLMIEVEWAAPNSSSGPYHHLQAVGEQSLSTKPILQGRQSGPYKAVN